MLASIIAGIFDKPSYMTPVYVVSKAFGHAFHLARKINNGYWRRTNRLFLNADKLAPTGQARFALSILRTPFDLQGTSRTQSIVFL